MNNFYQFSNQVKIVAGKDSINDLAKEMALLGAKNILIVSDQNLQKIGYVKKIKSIVATNTKLRVNAVYVNVKRGSSRETVEEAYTLFRDNSCDSIIACGGGSVINTAECLKLMLATKTKSLTQVYGVNSATKQEKVPFAAIPTTIGGGCDIAQIADILDETGKSRHELISEVMQPDVCILDPSFVKSLPKERLILGGIEILIDSAATYLDKSNNPISNNYALYCIKNISKMMQKYQQTGELDEDVCLMLQEAGVLAGMALSSLTGGIAHAITNAICVCTTAYHNLVLAMVFPKCLAYSKDKSSVQYAKLLQYSVSHERFRSYDSADYASAFVDLVSEIIGEILKKYNLPKNLKDLGITEDMLDKIAELACNDSSLISSVRWYETSDVCKILNDCMGDEECQK